MPRKSERERLAERDLKNYMLKAKAAETIPLRIRQLEQNFTAIRSALTDSTPVSGGTNKRENALAMNIAARDAFAAELAEIRAWLRAVDKALEVLDGQERLIIDRCYIHNTRDWLERLKDELHLEQSQIYYYRDLALYKFTIAYYGRRGE